MAIKCCVAVVANRTGQEVVLNIGPLDARPSADKAAGLEMVTRT